MNLTAYELSIISGAFTIVGALIGAIATYRFGIYLFIQQQRSVAAANFRAAFSYTISQMAIAQTDKNISIETLLVRTFPDLATAIETYRPFVPCKNRQAYQETWQNYYQVGGGIRFFDYYVDETGGDINAPYQLFKQRIEAIFNHAPP